MNDNTNNNNNDGNRGSRSRSSNPSQPPLPRQVIGEGSFGCVLKPSLKCNTPQDIDYAKHVSKFMRIKNAVQEHNEFLQFSKLDVDNEFHLGTPVLCHPDLSKVSTRRDVRKCDAFKKVVGKNADPAKFGLLLMKDGGYDCAQFVKHHLKTNPSQMDVDLFWLAVHRLFRGLCFFRENNVVHNDIKPHNIMYNPDTHTLKFIDFGMMRSVDTVVDASTRNNNRLGDFFWSFPLDCGFMNRSAFFQYKRLSDEGKERWKRRFINHVVYNRPSKRKPAEFKIASADNFDLLFGILTANAASSSSLRLPPPKVLKVSFIDRFVHGLNLLMEHTTYEHFLTHVIYGIDVYGLGFTLQFLASAFKAKNGLTLGQFVRLSAFFNKMYDFSPAAREINVDALITEYEEVLMSMGVLNRLHVRFVNHEVQHNATNSDWLGPFDSPSGDDSGSSGSSHIDSSSTPLSPGSGEKTNTNTNANTNENTNDDDLSPCMDPHKVRNVFTNRCVQQCKPGQVRNEMFKCERASCSQLDPNKETNPNTGRCVNKCAEGEHRDVLFRCRRPVSCPEHKEYNAKTKRCINKCGPSERRNRQTMKCVHFEPSPAASQPRQQQPQQSLLPHQLQQQNPNTRTNSPHRQGRSARTVTEDDFFS